MIKKFLKKMIYTILVIIGILIVAFLLFTNFYPSFGANISEEQELVHKQSKQFKEGKFRNKKDVPKDLGFIATLNLAYKFFTTKVINGRPKNDLKVIKTDSTNLANYNEDARMIWMGHSSFILQLDGNTILLDPMFGKVAAPHDFLGANRFNEEFPLEIEKLPQIDAVVFSHDHYDHLDYKTILKIKDKTNHFYVPLGLGAHLEVWGVDSNKITEMDWWQETKLKNITLVCTPAQHFSGRKFTNTQSTLWSSWVIQTEQESIYFGGDSGYGVHFNEIGDKYGPFDLALLECGQYNKMWPDIHMMPEETAQAGIDIQAKRIMPIHWAGFKLALHEWTDPVIRVQAKAKELNLEVITPQIGENIIIKDSLNTYKDWWIGL